MQLDREEYRRNKVMAQHKNFDAIIAIIDHRIAINLDKLVHMTDDHRFTQGAVQALMALRSDIVVED